MEFDFENEVIFWRGPSPFHFLALPSDQSDEIRSISSAVSYGWGVIPVTAHIGQTEWTTSLIPKDGVYLLPLRDMVRVQEQIDVGQLVHALVTIVPAT